MDFRITYEDGKQIKLIGTAKKKKTGQVVKSTYSLTVYVNGKRAERAETREPLDAWEPRVLGPSVANRLALPEGSGVVSIGGKNLYIPAKDLKRYWAWLTEFANSGVAKKSLAFVPSGKKANEDEIRWLKDEIAKWEEWIAQGNSLPATDAEAKELAKQNGNENMQIPSQSTLNAFKKRLAYLNRRRD